MPCPLLSSNISPASVPMSKFTPHRAAHRMSLVNLFLYFLISGDSESFGVIFTCTWSLDESVRLGRPPIPIAFWYWRKKDAVPEDYWNRRLENDLSMQFMSSRLITKWLTNNTRESINRNKKWRNCSPLIINSWTNSPTLFYFGGRYIARVANTCTWQLFYCYCAAVFKDNPTGGKYIWNS